MPRKPKPPAQRAWYEVLGPDGVVHPCYSPEEAARLYDRLYPKPEPKTKTK